MVSRHISFVGDSVHTMANMWLVQTLTGSALAMGSVFIAYTIPQIVFSLIGGVSVDRYNRKRILICSDVLRAIGVFSLAILAYFDQLMVWEIALVAAFNGAAGAFFSPAVSASVPLIVEQNELQRANALNNMNVRFAGMWGTWLGGVVVSEFGAWGGYSIDSVTFLLSALLIFGIRIPHMEREQSLPSAGFLGVWQDLKDGLQFILSKKALLALAPLSVAVNIVAISIPVLLPSFSEVTLRLTDPAQVAFLWSGMVIGLFLGGYLLASFLNGIEKVLGILTASCLFGVGALMLALFPWYFGAVTSMILMGFSMSVTMILSTTLYQTLVPKEYLGRFFGNLGLFTLGLTPIVIWLVGLVADRSSARMVYAGLGGFLLIFCVLWATQYLSVRRAIQSLG